MADKFDPEDVLDDLTIMAVNGEIPITIGRDKEVQRLITILSRDKHNNAIIIGKSGVGKTTVVKSLANRIANPGDNGILPSELQTADIKSLNLAKLKGTATQPGEAMQNMLTVVNSLKTLTKKYWQEKENPNIPESEKQGQVILFIDEIQDCFGGEYGDNFLEMLKPELDEGSILLIGACTTADYQKHILSDEALARRFQPVKVEEANKEETLMILRNMKKHFERTKKVIIEDSALQEIVRDTDRYIKSQYQPAKSIDVLDLVATKVAVQRDSKPFEIWETENTLAQAKAEMNSLAGEESEKSQDRLEVVKQIVEKKKKEINKLNNNWIVSKQMLLEASNYNLIVENINELIQKTAEEDSSSSAKIYAEMIILKKKFEAMRNRKQKILENNKTLKTKVSPIEVGEEIYNITGIPANKLGGNGMENIDKMPANFRKVVKGQDDVIDYLVEVLEVSSAGLQDPDRPIASFFWLGSTGVGKTELAKELANQLLGTRSKLIKFDMSEYQKEESVNNLIGAPAGYVGYDAGGVLTNAVKNNPYSVLLFDEVEKAHVKVFDIMLQLLDEGRLTDNNGDTVDFKNTIVIFTSNIGASVDGDLYKEFMKNGSIKGLSEDQLRDILLDYRFPVGQGDAGFRPEFIARIDKVQAFEPLSEKAFEGIIHKMLSKKQEQIIEKGDYKVVFDEATVIPYVKVISGGTDPESRFKKGARTVRAKIGTGLMNRVSKTVNDDKKKGTFNPKKPYKIWVKTVKSGTGKEATENYEVKVDQISEEDYKKMLEED